MFCNPTGDKIKLKDAYVNYLYMSNAYASSGKETPQVVLPKGITWGSKAEDIEKAYGKPDYVFGDDEDSEFLSYTYYINESEGSWNTDTVYLWINKKDGLEEIGITCNTWEN